MEQEKNINQTGPEYRRERLLGSSELLKEASLVALAVQEKGGKALIVGGFARDEIMRRLNMTHEESKDVDMEVYGLPIENLQEVVSQFGSPDMKGESFAVFKIRVGDSDLDISIPRRDSKVGPGHKGFIVEGDPTMSTREAARRRDLTINALAIDPLTGDIVDEFGGVEDLKNHILRATDMELFGDDPLRVLRLMQFAGRFGFDIDEATLAMAKTLPLEELPRERIGEEWRKLLLKSPKPSIGLEAGRRLEVIKKLHPELYALIGVPQEPQWHPEGDVWTHTCMVVDAAADIIRRENCDSEESLVVMLAAFCHDLGKPPTTEYKADKSGNMAWRSQAHESAGADPTRDFLKNFESLKNQSEICNKVIKIVENHLFPGLNPDANDAAVRRLANRLSPATIKELVMVSESDHRGRALKTSEYTAGLSLLKKAQELSVQDARPERILSGRHVKEILGKEDERIGKVVDKVYDAQLDGEITTLEAGQEMAKRLIEQQDNPTYRLETHRTELQNFGLSGLEGRLVRGLDPAGMLAVEEVRDRFMSLFKKAKVDVEKLEELTKDLHTGGIWTRANELSLAENLEVQAWMLLADECHEVNDKELTQEEYFEDVDRIKKDVGGLASKPLKALKRAKKKIMEEAKRKFVKKNGVPFSEEDAFLHMAIAGEEFGVCKAGNLYFAGAKQLDYSILEKSGLIAVEKEDRGRVTTFYQRDGVDVVKKLYDGLAIVFGDEVLALQLAKSSEKFF